MGNCRSAAVEAQSSPNRFSMSDVPEADRLEAPRNVTSVATPPRHREEVDRDARPVVLDADWALAERDWDMLRDSENASQSSCPMGPRNGTTTYESPLLGNRGNALFPSADVGTPFMAPNALFESIATKGTDVQLIHSKPLPGERNMLSVIQPGTVLCDTRPADDQDSVCSQNSGSGPLNADRTMTFRETNSGQFEAVRSWLTSLDSGSDAISSERTASLIEVQ